MPTSGLGFVVEVDIALTANDWFIIQEFGFTRKDGLDTTILSGPYNLNDCKGNKKKIIQIGNNNE